MKKILSIIFSVVFLTACVDTLDDYNVDQKRATNAPPEALFTNAVKNLADVMTTPNVNTNNFRLYVQHWTTTTYLDEPRYNLTARTIPQAFWQALYRDVLADLNSAKEAITSDPLMAQEDKTIQLAQVEIISVYAWSVLVNTFGDIPYTESLDPEIPLPQYDEASAVYADLLTRLDAALSSINSTGVPFTTGDVLYEGDMEKWAKFGNSLKLRMGITLADIDQGTAATIVGQAAPNVFTSNEDNARFPYLNAAPNNNPVSTNLNPLFTRRQDFIVAGTFVNQLNTLQDPRRQFYFTEVNGQYVGGDYGFSNSYAENSKPSEMVTDPAFEALLLDYAEVEFLLAEAVERGFITGDAATHYENGIRASILYWGGTEQDVTAYLANSQIAYATAAGNYKEKIGTQLWIALYNRGWDAWLHWRRLDAPLLLPPTGNGAPPGLAIPVRLIYPINEQTLNPANREVAASRMGGDLATTRLFWDVDSASGS